MYLLAISALLVLAALMPNHYFPWSTAWNDGVAIVSLLFILSVLVAQKVNQSHASKKLAFNAAACLCIPVAQGFFGQIWFGGDIWITLFFVLLWFVSAIAGHSFGSSTRDFNTSNLLAGAWFIPALLSVGIALVQWTGAINLGIYGVEMPPGGRPFANLAQPNNFSTLCFLGLCALIWLHQSLRVSTQTFWLAAIFLLFGMVLSQSRTGWLQIALLVAWGWWMQPRAALRLGRSQFAALGAAFAFVVTLRPWISEALLLSGGRALGEQMQPGLRLPYWQMMLDAISREPWFGYGWQQVGSAQQRVALDHPPLGDFFEHAHNFFLDLMLWNGIPVGALITGLLVWWFWSHIRACRDARVFWLLAAVGGVFVHAMLELPLEYAYFLIPVGLAMGAIDGLSPAQGKTLRVPRWALLCGTGLLTLGFVVTASDYLKAEENYRTLRLESARIGVGGIVTPAVDLHVLTQLEAFLQFARIEAKPNMPPEQVDWMRKVALRFGYPPVLFRYALAAGLNGLPDIAQQTLERICRIHPPQRCDEAQQGWTALQTQYPQLAAIKAPQK